MGESSAKDELAQTATAPGSTPRLPAEPCADTLGRYRLERRLGEGGMGVVHAAFDPDLERRVALKVLRRTDGSEDARQRLLREARALARLSHPNVVVVHEVGTAGDRDYVAMELIDGETLADWLRHGRRSVHEITQAFIAAGRGLAAAHAAGLVHRDFKPHNVLRHRDGRVIVTDFGLARAAGAGVGAQSAAIALETTLRPDQALASGESQSTPSSLSEITATGSVLGTPAYMAPEQWAGGSVGPAADQFAFCVALWEALTGERPFKGKTLDELRSDVKRGVAAADASKLPRRLRAPLRRGLQLEPRDRYPDMGALLEALVRADRRSSALSLAWRGALVLGTIGYLVARAIGGGGTSCESPLVELGHVWSPTIASTTPHELVAPFDKLAVRWTMARATACTADRPARDTQLHCLDGVLSRFAAVRDGFARVPAAQGEDAMEELVDPSVCLTPAPPRLGLADNADTALAFELLARAKAAGDPDDPALVLPPVAPVQALIDKPGIDPCARSIAQRALERTALDYTAKHAAITDAVQAGEACEDDRVHAETMLELMPYQFEMPVLGPRALAAIRGAAGVVARVAQIDLSSHVDMARARVAFQEERWTEAVGLLHAAAEQLYAEGFQHHALKVALEEVDAYFHRGRPEDYTAARAVAARWLPVAGEVGDAKLTRALEREDAFARYWLGDVEAAHAELMRLWQPYVDPQAPHRKIEGDVVDAAGKPVAGAAVAAGARLGADAIGALSMARLHEDDGGLRQATTDAHGHFEIEAGPMHGAIFAQAGELRSNPQRIADRMHLVLVPTRTVSGTIALGGRTYTEVAPVALTPLGDAFALFVPLRPDGSFTLRGVPTEKVGIAVDVDNQFGAQLEATPLPAGAKPITDLALHVPASGRTLDVLARSTLAAAIDTAQIVIVPGHQHITSVGQLNGSIDSGLVVRFASHAVGENVPRPALDQLKPGDLWARFTDIAPGDLTVCSLGLAGDFMDRSLMRKLQAHLDELEVHCVPVDGDANVVVVPTAPQKRFD